MAKQLTKIYELKTVGGESALEQLHAINKAFIEIATTKRALNQQRGGIEDPAELKKIDAALADLTKRHQDMVKEARNYQSVVKEEQIAKGRAAKDNEALAGSYDQLKTKYQELLAIAKGSVSLSNPDEVATAAAELGKLKSQLDAFDASLKAHNATEKVGAQATKQANAEKAASDKEYVKTWESLLAERDAVTAKSQKNAVNAIANDSLKAMSATLEQHRRSYSLLTQAERENVEIGGVLLARIKELDTQLKATDANQGKFTRNVGNYKSATEGLAGTQTNFSRTLGQISGEFTNLAYGAKTFFSSLSNNLGPAIIEFKNLAAAMKAAKLEGVANASAEGEQAKATALAGGASEEAANQIGELAKQQALAALEATRGRGVWAALGRSLFSFQTFVGIAIAALTIFGPALYDAIVEAFGDAKDAIDTGKKSLELFATALDSVDYKKAIVSIAELTKNVKLAKEGLIDKTDVIEQYNQSIGEAAGKVTELDGVEQGLAAHSTAYVQMMLYKAAATAAYKEAADKAVQSQKSLSEIGSGNPTLLDQFLGRGFGGVAQADKRRKDEAEKAQKQADQLLGIAGDFQKKFAETAKNNGLDSGLGGNIAPGSVADLRKRIQLLKEKIDTEKVGSAQQKADTKQLIELERQLKAIEGHQSRGKRAHDTTNEELEADRFNIEQRAKLREADYHIDAEQQRLLFEDVKQSLDKRLQAYNEYSNDLRLIAIQDKDAQIQAVQATLAKIEEVKKKQAGGGKITPAQKKLLDQESGYLDQLERLNKEKIAALAKIDADAHQARVGIIKSDIQEILRGIDQLKEQAAIHSNEALLVLQNSYTSGAITYKKFKEKEKELANEAHIYELNLIKKYLVAQIAAFEAAGRDASGLRNALSKVNAELIAATNAQYDALAKKAFDLQKFYKDLKAAAADAARTVADSYIANEDRKIDKDTENAKKAQDIEKQKRLDLASSAAEKAAIEKEYDQKAEVLERDRFERHKKQAEAQLEIEFAVASIKAISAGFDTGGIYGAIAAEALVAFEYAAKYAALENATYEQGGELRKILGGGGIFSGPSHTAGGIRFTFGGLPREVQGNEGYVINDGSMASRSVYTVTGTPSQIASAANVTGGGVNFAPGASFGYGGSLGAGLTAPYFSTSSSGNNDVMMAMLATVQQLAANQAATNDRIDNLRVTLNPHAVTEAQDRQAKLTKMTTL